MVADCDCKPRLSRLAHTRIVAEKRKGSGDRPGPRAATTADNPSAPAWNLPSRERDDVPLTLQSVTDWIEQRQHLVIAAQVELGESATLPENSTVRGQRRLGGGR